MWPLLVRQTHRAWTHKCYAVRQSLREFAHTQTHCTTTADSNECSTRPLLLMFWCRFIYLTMEVNEWRKKMKTKTNERTPNRSQTIVFAAKKETKIRTNDDMKKTTFQNYESCEKDWEREKSKCEFIHISHQRMNERRTNRKKWAKTHSKSKQLERTNGCESFAHTHKREIAQMKCSPISRPNASENE